MGKSIEYIKQRLPDCKFDSMYEMDKSENKAEIETHLNKGT